MNMGSPEVALASQKDQTTVFMDSGFAAAQRPGMTK